MNETSKKPSESAIEQNVYKVFPNDLNSKYTVFGGLVMGPTMDHQIIRDFNWLAEIPGSETECICDYQRTLVLYYFCVIRIV